jgi:hypothetical protein
MQVLKVGDMEELRVKAKIIEMGNPGKEDIN